MTLFNMNTKTTRPKITATGLRHIKTIRSNVGVARFLAECEGEAAGWIQCQVDIPSPYAYSPEWAVMRRFDGQLVILREVSHRCFEIYAVPASLVSFTKL